MQTNNICVLPDDVLIIIFKYLSNSFALLSVSARWRKLALPIVYKRSWISYAYSDACPLPCNKTGSVLGEPAGQIISTNCQLASDSDTIRSIKELVITISYRIQPFLGLDEVVTTLQNYAANWPHVNTLFIELIRCLYDDTPDEPMDTYEGDIIQITERFFTLMPNVTEIGFEDSGAIRPSRILFGNLSAAYSQNITHIAFRPPPIFQSMCEFANLTYLNIDLWSMNIGDYPVIPSESLINLVLRYIPFEFSWSAFKRDSKTNDIKFTNLVELVLDTGPTNFRSSTPDGVGSIIADTRMFHFPKLKTLNINSRTNYLPIFENCIFPKGVKLFQLSCQLNSLQTINIHKLPQIDKLNMTIVDQYNNSESNVFALVENFARKATNIEKIKLTVSKEETLRPIINASYIGITELNAFALIDASTIISTVTNLPMLNSVSFSNVVFTEEQAQVYNSEADGYNPEISTPMNLHVERLELRCPDDGHKGNNFIAFVEYLLPRLPSVKHLRMAGLPRGTKYDIIKVLSPKYPHLANIKVVYR